MTATVAPRVRRWWTDSEDQILRQAANSQLKEGILKDWGRIAAKLPGRTNKDCRKRWSKVCNRVNKGVWSADEDKKLEAAIGIHGSKWTHVAAMVGTRHADQCAKRWQHSLDPELDRGEWTCEDDQRLLAAVAAIGRNWRAIGERKFPARSATDIKNRYVILDRRRRQPAGKDTSAGSSSSLSIDDDGDDEPQPAAPAPSATEDPSSSPSDAEDDGLDFDACFDACFDSFDDFGLSASGPGRADCPTYLFDHAADLGLRVIETSGDGQRSTPASPSARTPSSATSSRLFGSARASTLSSSHSEFDPLTSGLVAAGSFGGLPTSAAAQVLPWTTQPTTLLDTSAPAVPDAEGDHPMTMLTSDSTAMLGQGLAAAVAAPTPPGVQEWTVGGAGAGEQATAGGPRAHKTMLVLEDVHSETVNAMVATLLASRREVKMRLYTVQE